MAHKDDEDTGGQSDLHRQTGAMGGRARAASLSNAELSASGRKAALARWSAPRETHEGNLETALGIDMPCSVLSNGMRVLSTRGFSRAFGSRKTGTNNTGTGAPQPPPFLASKSLLPFIPEHLIVLLNSPVVYLPKVGGRSAYGYEARLFPEVCKAIVAADRAGALRPSQKRAAAAAQAMLDALVGVAMVALIDEATGYQADRARDELQQILRAYVVEEMLPWLERFPQEFFRQIYRLMNWKFEPGSAKRPGFVGKIINEWIYKRLPEPVLPRLREVNPKINGNRRAKHHQFLTPDTGIPHLDDQIKAVTTLMRASRDRRMFEELLVNAFPKSGDQMPLGTAT
jgi:hypothetical protein